MGHVLLELHGGGEQDALEPRRHVRGEVDGRADLTGDLALVNVVGQRVGDNVVVKVQGVVLLGGGGARPRVACQRERDREMFGFGRS